jgi:hypothetical protein
LLIGTTIAVGAGTISTYTKMPLFSGPRTSLNPASGRQTANMSDNAKRLSADWNSIGYRLHEVLDQENHYGLHISCISLLAGLLRLTLIVLLVVEFGVTFMACSTWTATTDRRPMAHHLSANNVRHTHIGHVALMEDRDAPNTR